MAAITKEPLYQQAYVILREQILSGDRPAGERINVQVVADELGISRTPVREAVRQLVQEGLLEGNVGGRVTVFKPSATVLAEIYVVRAAIESVAAASLASIADTLDLSTIDDALARGRAAVDASDWQGAIAANTDWHDAVLDLSDNQIGIKTLDSLRPHVVRHRSVALRNDELRAKVQAEHEAITQLIRDRDVEGVRRSLVRHVLRSGGVAVRSLRVQNGDTEPVSTSEHLLLHALEHQDVVGASDVRSS